jgi:hypothetical protein
MRTYNLFISHSWSYNEEYERLVKLLNSSPDLQWKNYSVPFNDPLAGGSRTKLASEIESQIRLASVVLVISGMYVTYREWIQFEIDVSDKFNKPIVGIQPWGSVNTPFAVTRSAAEIVGWNSSSIVDAIKRNAI